MKVYLLENPIPIYVPYNKAVMSIETDLLTKELNEIAMFILIELNRCTPVEQLKKIINVPSENFEELLAYLKNHQLLDEELMLTQRGEMYATLYEEIDRFNKNAHEAFLNLYTGELEIDIPIETEPVPKNALKAPIKIQRAVRKMYEDNIDQAPNTRRVIKQLIENKKFSPTFETEITDTLHLQLKLQHSEVWSQRNISSIPIANQNGDLPLIEIEADGEPFHLMLPVKVQHLKPIHQLVVNYEKDLPLLKKLSEELLSEKALKVLKQATKGEKMKAKRLYHYGHLQCTVESPLHQENIKTFKKLALPKQFDWIDEKVLKERFFSDLNSNWRLISEQTLEEYFHVQGPFEAFFITLSEASFDIKNTQDEQINSAKTILKDKKMEDTYIDSMAKFSEAISRLSLFGKRGL